MGQFDNIVSNFEGGFFFVVVTSVFIKRANKGPGAKKPRLSWYQTIADLDTLIGDAEAVRKPLADIGNFLITRANDLFFQEFQGAPVKNTNDGFQKFEGKLIGRDVFMLGNTKSINRVLSKQHKRTKARIKAKEKGEISSFLQTITDFTRGKLDLSENNHIAAVAALLVFSYENPNMAVLPHGAVVTKIKNAFKNPTATFYSSFKANLAIPVPGKERYHITELMVRHGGFEKYIEQDTKNRFNRGSHGAFEIERAIMERAKAILLEKCFKKAVSQDQVLVAGQANQLCRNIHTRGRRKFGLDFIPFERFSDLMNEKAYYELERQPQRTSLPEESAVQQRSVETSALVA